jgi:hypothetical protein
MREKHWEQPMTLSHYLKRDKYGHSLGFSAPSYAMEWVGWPFPYFLPSQTSQVLFVYFESAPDYSEGNAFLCRLLPFCLDFFFYFTTYIQTYFPLSPLIIIKITIRNNS